MASSYEKDFQSLSKDLKKLGEEANKTLKDLNEKNKSYASSWSEIGKKIVSSIDPVAISQKKIEEIQAKIVDKQNLQVKLSSQIQNLENQKSKIQEDDARFSELKNKDKKTLTDLEKRELENLQKSEASRQQTLAAIQKKLPLLEREKNNAQTTEKSLMGQADSLKMSSAAMSVIKDTLSQIYAMAGEYDKFLSEQAKTLGISKDIIDAQYKSIQQNNTGLAENAATSREIVAAQTKVLQDYPLIGKQASNVAQSVAQTAKSTGLSVEESTKLQATLAEIGGTSLSAQNNMAGFAIQAAKAYGVPLNVLLKDVANASGAVRTIFKGNTEELIKQAAEARKLGTSLDAAAKSAEALLNFDSSIRAELKASALLGQNLNFNESRRLAFVGDLLGAEKALQKELERVGDLDKLNYNQRKALAEATGKDFGELQKIQTQKKNQLEIEKRFPEEAKKLKMMQDDLSNLQKKSKEDRDAEYKKILEQQKVEAQSQLTAQAKADAMDKIGQVLKPVYDLFTKIQTAFFKLISMAPTWAIVLGLVVVTIVGIGVAIGSVFGGFKLFQNAIQGLGESIGRGVGKGLTAMSSGLTSLGTSMRAISPADLARLAAILILLTGAAFGLGYAMSMLGKTSASQILAFTAALVILGAGLLGVGLLLTPPSPIGIGLLKFAGALAITALAAMGFAKAIQMVGPQLSRIGEVFVVLGSIVGGVITKAFDTILGVFTALPGVIDSVASGLMVIANIGFFKLTRAAAGVAAVSAAIFDLGKSLSSFPVTQLTSITTQIDMLSKSAQGLRYAVDSLKELSNVKLPKLEFGGLATLAAVATVTSTSKNKESQELKQGLEVVAQKIEILTNMMANGGIAVNLDGQKVNYALAKSANNRGSLGQATF